MTILMIYGIKKGSKADINERKGECHGDEMGIGTEHTTRGVGIAEVLRGV